MRTNIQGEKNEENQGIEEANNLLCGCDCVRSRLVGSPDWSVSEMPKSRPCCPRCKMVLRRMYMTVSNNGKVGVAWGCQKCNFVKWDNDKKVGHDRI